jgi:choline dehydrogenase-like flavoprotein
VIDSPRSLAFAYDWVTKRIFSKRKLPSIALKSRKNIYTLHYDSEQTHIKDSSITLADTNDEYGMPRLKVDWKYDESDLDKIFASYKTIIKELENSGAGISLNSDAEVQASIKDQVGVGSHHVGSTRMSSNPKEGVVDENCKVHDVSNLYLASPSVFCTGGFANPLLTIVALSIRIADHLKKKINA